MPWADAEAVATGELDARDANRISLIGNNILENYVNLPQWKVVRDLTTGTDYTDNEYFPPVFGFDRNPGSITRPQTVPNGTTDIYYLCSPTAGTSIKYYFDTVLFINHNFANISNLRFDIVIASNATFSSDVYTIFSSGAISNNTRTGSVNLDNDGTDEQRFYNVPYLAVRFYRNGGGNFNSLEMPQFGDLWIGRRRQLPYVPDVPYDPSATESDIVDYVSDGGHRHRTAKSVGRGFFKITTRSGGADRLFSINAATQLRLWWQECDHGSKPSLLCLGGAAKTDNMYVVSVPDARLEIPYLGPLEREASFELIESAPYVSAEEG